MRKRGLSILLCLVMLVGLMPTTAFADGNIISSANITITKPVGGETPDFNPVSSEPEKYYAEVDDWGWMYAQSVTPMGPESKFKALNRYVLRILFRPKHGYFFANDCVFTINGEKTGFGKIVYIHGQGGESFTAKKNVLNAVVNALRCQCDNERRKLKVCNKHTVYRAKNKANSAGNNKEQRQAAWDVAVDQYQKCGVSTECGDCRKRNIYAAGHDHHHNSNSKNPIRCGRTKKVYNIAGGEECVIDCSDGHTHCQQNCK